MTMDRRTFVGTAAACGLGAAALAGTALADEADAAAVEPVDVVAIAAAAADALPGDVAHLPVIEAEFFAEIAPGSPSDALEGSMFDKDGTLYVIHRFKEEVGGEQVTSSEIVKVDEDGNVEQFVYMAASDFAGLAIHADGRFFVADGNGHLWIYAHEGGEPLGELPLDNGVAGDHQIKPNDCVFDANTGDLYLTDFNSSLYNPVGGVYRFTAESDYTEANLVVGDMATPNGISFNLDCTALFVSETGRNLITKITLDNGVATKRQFPNCVTAYQGQGVYGPDSNRLDADGNLYQCYMPAGRMLVLNKDMYAIANVVPFDRANHQGWKTTSLALHPTKPEGYMLSGGTRGMWVLKFDALAACAPLWHLADEEAAE